MQILRVALSVMLTCAMAPAAREKPNPRAEPAGMVKLLVNAQDNKGRPVKGMRKEEFHIFEDGREQRIESFADAGTEPLTVGLMIDTSGSRREQFPGAEQGPAKRFFREMLVGKNQGFVVNFDERAFIDADVTANISQLDKAIDRGVRALAGASALFDAVHAACTKISAGLGRRALVIVTDGDDNKSVTKLDAVIEAAQRNQTALYIVRVTYTPRDSRTQPLLQPRKSAVQAAQRMADATGGICFVVKKEGDMGNAFVDIAEVLRTQYALVFSGAQDGKFHNIEIKTTRKDVKVPKGRGYYAVKK